MAASVTVEVKIPAVKHGLGQRDQREKYTTSLPIKLTTDKRVLVADYEFDPEDFMEAVGILREHNAVRT